VGADPDVMTAPVPAVVASPEPPQVTTSTPEGVAVLSRSEIYRTAAGRLLRSLGWLVLSIVVTIAIWEGFLHLYHVPRIVARTPLDVWHYLFTQKASKAHALRSAAGNRSVLWHNLKTTLRDAAVGYVAGFVSAIVVSSIFVMWKPAEQTFMPVALTLRSVPLIAMAPVITLVCGRGLLSVAVISGIVCFFPALINMMTGLRSATKSSLDLMRVYGASKWTTLRKVQIPSAMPSIFAALRINVPAAIIGALLAEWLATDRGSGAEMLTVLNTFDYGELWSAVVIVTLVSVIGYSIVSMAETVVLARYAPATLVKKN
jgi:ABC-type nitrate/sulfonate/bicarbonate transport system permease component